MPGPLHDTTILQAVTRLQNRFIREPNPRQRFTEALETLLQLTDSEYGFIGEVLLDAAGQPFLRTHAITDIAWNEEIRHQVAQSLDSGLEFYKLDNLFGEVIKKRTVVISNEPHSDARRGGLPPGHPALRSFLGIPFLVEGELIGMAGMANRPQGYDVELSEWLAPLMASCASMIWATRNERLRQEAEQALRASERHAQAVSELVTFVTFSGPIDPQGNMTFHRYRGSKIQMPMNVPLPLIELMKLRMSPDDVALGMRNLELARAGQDVIFEYQSLGDDGLPHWFSCHVRPQPYPTGGDGWIMTYGAIIDITEKKLAELETIRQKQELQTIFDAMQARVIYFDTEGRFLRQNAFSRRASGMSDEEQLGKIATEVALFWDDAELRHAETLEVVRTGESRLGSLETYTENGERRWASVDKVPTRAPNGAITGVLVFIRDITDQRRAEIALEERNRFIERVSALTPNYMYVFDCDRIQPVYINRPASNLLGIDDEQSTNDFAIADYMHVDDLTTVMTHLRDAVHLADGEIAEFNYRLRQPDGSYRWMMSRSMPFERRADGTVRLTVGMSIDITSLKETEAALRNMVQRNDALLQAIPDLMFLLSADNKFIDFHAPELTLLAVSPEKFLGHDVAEVLPAEIVANLETARRAASTDGLVHSFEYTMDIGGEPRRHEARVVACGVDQTLVIARDITERMRAETALRESEARFRQFADGIDHVIWMATPAMDTTIFVNRAYETIFGRPREEMLAQPTDWMRAVYTDDRPRVSEAMSKLPSGPQRSEFRILRPDGSLRWLRGLGLPILSESGEIYMYAGVFEDITAAKASAERLNAQQTELAHVSRLSTLGQMVAAVAHEITQPLSAVANYAAVSEQLAASDANSQPDLKQMLGNISAQAQRAGSIIQQLRSYARRTQQHRTLHDVNAVLRDSIALMAIDSSHRLTIVYDWQPQLPRVFVDRVQIQQVLINLFTNACEAGEEAGADPNRVIIRARLEERHVVIEVHDSGRGIAHNDTAQLFQPFFTTKPQGLGMGLAICRTIIESHGGTITVENQPAAGACFIIRLPAGE